jgi:hypothetical protein
MFLTHTTVSPCQVEVTAEILTALENHLTEVGEDVNLDPRKMRLEFEKIKLEES